MQTKEQLVNLAMICTSLLLLASFLGLYSFVNVVMEIGFNSLTLFFQLIPTAVLIGLFAWGLTDLNQYRLTGQEGKGIRVLRVWVLLSAATYPVYAIAISKRFFESTELLLSPYLLLINVLQAFFYVLLSLAFYRLYKLQSPSPIVFLDVIEAANPGKRLINFLIDTFGTAYFLMMIVSPIMLMLGGGDGVEGMVELLLVPLFAVGMILYYALTEAFYHQSLGKAMTDTQVYYGPKVTSRTATVWQRSFVRMVPFEVISIFMQAGPWHDLWTDTKVLDFKVAKFEIKEQSSQHDVLDDGFIKRN